MMQVHQADVTNGNESKDVRPMPNLPDGPPRGRREALALASLLCLGCPGPDNPMSQRPPDLTMAEPVPPPDLHPPELDLAPPCVPKDKLIFVTEGVFQGTALLRGATNDMRYDAYGTWADGECLAAAERGDSSFRNKKWRAWLSVTDGLVGEVSAYERIRVETDGAECATWYQRNPDQFLLTFRGINQFRSTPSVPISFNEFRVTLRDVTQAEVWTGTPASGRASTNKEGLCVNAKGESWSDPLRAGAQGTFGRARDPLAWTNANGADSGTLPLQDCYKLAHLYCVEVDR